MLSGCSATRGPPPWRPGLQRILSFLVLRSVSWGVCPTLAVVTFNEEERWPAGLSAAHGEEVLRGNGDDLPGFGAYRTRRKRVEPARMEIPAEAAALRLLPLDPKKTWDHSHHGGVVRSYYSVPNPSPAMKKFLFLLSIIIAFCGSTLTVMGMVLQKYAHQKMLEGEDIRNDDLTDKDRCLREQYCYLLNFRWILGLAVFAVGNAVTWVALGMGPNSVLACFNSWNIIFSMVVAPMWFGERVPPTAKLSAVVLIGGCIWVTICGPRSYRLHTIDSINMLFARFPFTLCCIICMTILAAAKIKHWFWQKERVWSASASVQITSMASIFSCYAVLFSKCTSMLVQSSVLSNISQVGSWQFYLWSCATVVCGICQIYFLNESLRHGFASFVIPAYESMGMALQIIVGGVFFREYRKFTLAKHLSFWPGVLLVLSGLVFLTRSSASGPMESTEGDSPEAAVARSVEKKQQVLAAATA
mmetsp:Transcript_29654/g.80167  ORF Transcript_29654/g.80167 Transcript_29654/m.80167 type:complete len:473 (-) Transcript_29654:50-1468(-)